MDVESPKKITKRLYNTYCTGFQQHKRLYNILYPSKEGYEGTKIRNIFWFLKRKTTYFKPIAPVALFMQRALSVTI